MRTLGSLSRFRYLFYIRLCTYFFSPQGFLNSLPACTLCTSETTNLCNGEKRERERIGRSDGPPMYRSVLTFVEIGNEMCGVGYTRMPFLCLYYSCDFGRFVTLLRVCKPHFLDWSGLVLRLAVFEVFGVTAFPREFPGTVTSRDVVLLLFASRPNSVRVFYFILCV